MENIPAGYQLILCISLTDLYVFHGRHLAVDVFPTGFPYLPAFLSPLDSAPGSV
jgi:hypothetical protein